MGVERLKFVFSPILLGVFDQRIFHGGGKMPPYLTSKPKVMGRPNLACGLVFAERF